MQEKYKKWKNFQCAFFIQNYEKILNTQKKFLFYLLF